MNIFIILTFLASSTLGKMSIKQKSMFNQFLLLTLLRILAKLLVATGDPTWTCIKTEVIDLMDDNSVCESLPDFPIEMASGFGGLLQGNMPVFCGGFNPNIEGYAVTDCYTLDKNGVNSNEIYPILFRVAYL